MAERHSYSGNKRAESARQAVRDQIRDEKAKDDLYDDIYEPDLVGNRHLNLDDNPELAAEIYEEAARARQRKRYGESLSGTPSYASAKPGSSRR